MSLNDAKRHITAATLAVLIVAVVILALTHPGMTTARVSLNDGGIWVTNNSKRLVAHLNYPSATLDAGLRASSADFDLSQHESQVVVHDKPSSSLLPVDVAQVSVAQGASVPGTLSSQGGGRMGIIDTKKGNVFSIPTADVEQFQIEVAQPSAKGFTNGVIATGVDGRVHVASARAKKQTTIVPDGHDTTEESEKLDVPTDARLAITAVGEQRIIMDQAKNVVYLPGGKTVILPGKNLQLQQPGPASPTVLVASATQLMKVRIADGSIEELKARDDNGKVQPGQPAQPVFHRGCAYSAWSGSGVFIRSCDGNDMTMVADKLAESSAPLFRTNRTIIVLNDVANGNVWLPDRKMMLVDSWDSVTSTVERQEEDEDDPDETEEITDPDRSKANRPPQAADDSFGVRPGRATMLPVLANDNDPDGDVLVAQATSKPDFGRIKQVRGGALLQVDVPEGATGTTSFTYDANDGRGGRDEATVKLTVHPWEQNDAPTQMRLSKVTLGARAKVTYNVLPDWIDPDGDSMYLAGASSDGKVLVTYREDGVVSIEDSGAPAGLYSIKLTVSDGKKSAQGSISVDLRDGDNLPPKANGDLVVAKAGEDTTLHPLDNDTDPNGDRLMLVSVSAPSGQGGVEPDLNAGTAKFQATTPGTYYMNYVVSDGPATATGLIRVDVVDADKSGAPVAEDDTGMLPPGGQAVIDLTQNDSDPAGNVLVVQSITLPDNSPLEVALVDQHIARVSAPQGLSGSTVFTYTVSNGKATATAQVNVIALDKVSVDEPPIADSDSAVVRVGDVATVNVLANDRSPSGLKLRVRSKLDGDVSTELGDAFVSDNTVRFRAHNKPGTARVNYTVEDTLGNIDSAEVTFRINPMDKATNSAPRPRDVEARLLSGQTVKIPIPLYDIDDDGDSVQLVSLNSAASQGVADISGNAIEYKAGFEAKGTDTFTYTVEDRLGKAAVGQIRVGIAPAPPTNQPPIAVNDQVNVRPGRDIAVAVTVNDIDPDGDTLALVADSVKSQDDGFEVEARDGRIACQAPEREGVYKATYKVSDQRGGYDTGLLSVNVSKDAPLQAPIARDDIISVNDVPAGATSFSVPVLKNDDDPDGDIQSLTVTTKDEGASVNSANEVTVTLSDTSQLIMYTITDQDGLSSSAIIYVPPLVGDKVPPRLDPDMIPASVQADSTLSIPLSKYVIVRQGRSPIITDKNKVKVQVGRSTKPLYVSDEELQYAPPKDFGGMTAMTFEVTDGQTRSDATGLSSVLTLPIDVKAIENKMPIFRPTPVEVSADDTPVTVDLATMVVDPEKVDPHTFTYTLKKGVPGISTSLSGSQLTVKAPGGTKKGTIGQLTIEVMDEDNKVTGLVPVKVVTSSRPLMEIAPASIEADAGKATPVDVSSYITNPFPGKELYIAGKPRIVGGEGDVSVSGTTLSITPKAKFVGTMSVVYRAGDMTRDSVREQQGIIKMQVSAEPDAPVGVTVRPVGGTTANIEWTAGAANGKPITHFTMQEVASGATKECTGTQCQWTNLTPGERYSFKVSATNKVGTSPWSAPSTPVLIDTAPDQPSAPSIKEGDGMLEVAWPDVSSTGSPVSSYTVTLTHSVTGARTTQTVSVRSAKFTGLKNGDQYSVFVIAHNKSGKDSPPSAPSTGIPFGKPSAPGKPVATVNAGKANASSVPIDISWAPPGHNGGRTVTSYSITASTGESTTSTTTSATLTIKLGTPVTFTVKAKNDAGESPGATSDAVTAVGTPNAPTSFHAHATGKNGELRISGISGGGGNGWTTVTYEAQVNGGGWVSVPGTLTGITNAKNVTVSVRAVGKQRDQRFVSDSYTTTTEGPYGPVSYSMKFTRLTGTKGEFTWDIKGNGRDITSVTQRGIKLPGLEAMTPSGSHTVTGTIGKTFALCVNVHHGSAVEKLPCVEGKLSKLPAEGQITDVSGQRVTLNLQGFDDPDDTTFTCWNVPQDKSESGTSSPATINTLSYLQTTPTVITCSIDIGANGSIKVTSSQTSIWIDRK